MTDQMKYTLQRAIDSVVQRRHKLIVVTIPEDIGVSLCEQMELLSVDLNLFLSDKLQAMSPERRSRAVGKVIDSHIKQLPSAKAWVFQRFEILFLPDLQVNVMRLFEEMSKERVIILNWPGKYEDGVLSYGEPWHREYYEYNEVDGIIL